MNLLLGIPFAVMTWIGDKRYGILLGLGLVAAVLVVVTTLVRAKRRS